MMKKISRILVFLMAISLLFIAADKSLALAQSADEPAGFKNVQLWIYPEYDDPRLLVMLEGQITGAGLPAKVRFLVPSAAEMYSAGSMDAQGKYSGGPPDRVPSTVPGWDEISYEVTSDTFRVEYYDPIIIGHPDMTTDYEFRWLYPISDLEVIVQEPLRSGNFSVSPAAGQVSTDSRGFTYHHYNFSGLDDDPPLRFNISYTKTDTRPSLYVEDKGTTGSLKTVIIALVSLVVIAGAFLWLRKSRPRTRAERRRLAKNAEAHESKRPQQRKARFCTQCGQPAESSANFCQDCGAKLK